VQPLRQPCELVTRLAALLSNPTQHQLTTNEMVPNLFGCVVFDVEQDR